MSFLFVPVPFAEVKAEIAWHLESLVGRIDSFQEEHIRDANHYRIRYGDQPIGTAAIHGTNLITWFALDLNHRQLSQEAFAALRKQEHVTAAFVSTADGFYLANAIDNVREIKKQAYAFGFAPDRMRSTWAPFDMLPATTADVPVIRGHSGEFFVPYLDSVGVDASPVEIFVISRDGQAVAYGISDRSRLYAAVASIGMFVIEEHRHGGVGTATIGLLINEMHRRGLEPTAGCWYYNHASKRTLERAGLFAASRLLRIEY